MLEEALQSLVSQSHVPRIIVHDNCELGSAAEVCRKFSCVTYRKNGSNLGAIGNFLSLVEVCETEYFGWLQDDDVLFPNYAEEVTRCCEERQNVLCVLAYALNTHRLDRVERLGTPLFGPPGPADWITGAPAFFSTGAVLPWALVRSTGFCPVAVFRTEALRKALVEIDGIDFGIFWERAVLSSVSAQGDLAIIPRILGILRQHNESASNEYLRAAQADGTADYRRTLGNLELFIDSKSSSVSDDEFGRFHRELMREPIEDVKEFYATSSNFETEFGSKVFAVCRDVLGELGALPRAPEPLSFSLSVRKKVRALAWNVLPPFVARFIQRGCANIVARRSDNSK